MLFYHGSKQLYLEKRDLWSWGGLVTDILTAQNKYLREFRGAGQYEPSARTSPYKVHLHSQWHLLKQCASSPVLNRVQVRPYDESMNSEAVGGLAQSYYSSRLAETEHRHIKGHLLEHFGRNCFI